MSEKETKLILPWNDPVPDLGSPCGTSSYIKDIVKKDPSFADRYIQQELDAVKRIKKQREEDVFNIFNAHQQTLNVCVHFHVVLPVPGDITSANLQESIDKLNEDFSANNADLPSRWSHIAGNPGINFVWDEASRTDVVSETVFVWGPGVWDDIKKTSAGGSDPVGDGTILNVWIGDIVTGDGAYQLGGFATYPTTPGIQGVVIHYGTVPGGNFGHSVYERENLGRLLAHEVGHFFDLRHIWGDGDCSVDDFVTDTPLQRVKTATCWWKTDICGGYVDVGGAHVCPGESGSLGPAGIYKNTCAEGVPDQPDMWENYMDYSDDACMGLFTVGQADRMRDCLINVRSEMLISSCGGTTTTTTTTTSEPVKLIWPVPAGHSLITFYDPDWTGYGDDAYPGHHGVDIGFWGGSWSNMVNNPTDIYAAAGGTVIWTEDSYDDQCVVTATAGEHAPGGSLCNTLCYYSCQSLTGPTNDNQQDCEAAGGTWTNTPCVNSVLIDHGPNTGLPYRYTGYYHIAKNSIPAAVKIANAVVSKGDRIAYIGSSGSSTGPHIHFEVGPDWGGLEDGEKFVASLTSVDPFLSENWGGWLTAPGSNTVESLWEDQCSLPIYNTNTPTGDVPPLLSSCPATTTTTSEPATTTAAGTTTPPTTGCCLGDDEMGSDIPVWDSNSGWEVSEYVCYQDKIYLCNGISACVASTYTPPSRLIEDGYDPGWDLAYECTTTTTPTTTGCCFETSSFEQYLDPVIDNYINNGVYGATVAVSCDGTLVYAKGYSTQDSTIWAWAGSISDDTECRLASTSKLLTASAIALLVQNNQLSVNDKLVDILPQHFYGDVNDKANTKLFVDDRMEDITVYHLVHHQGGWLRDDGAGTLPDPDSGDELYSNGTAMLARNIVASGVATTVNLPPSDDLVVAYVNTLQLVFDPGTVTMEQDPAVYSNYGYWLLSLIVEEKSGDTLENYVTNEILDPHGIALTAAGNALAPDEWSYAGWGTDINNQLQVQSCCSGYCDSSGCTGPMVDTPYGQYKMWPGASGWLGNAKEHTKFLDIFHSNGSRAVFSQATIDMMMSPVNTYAWAQFIGADDGHSYHSGGDEGDGKRTFATRYSVDGIQFSYVFYVNGIAPINAMGLYPKVEIEAALAAIVPNSAPCPTTTTTAGPCAGWDGQCYQKCQGNCPEGSSQPWPACCPGGIWGWGCAGYCDQRWGCHPDWWLDPTEYYLWWGSEAQCLYENAQPDAVSCCSATTTTAGPTTTGGPPPPEGPCDDYPGFMVWSSVESYANGEVVCFNNALYHCDDEDGCYGSCGEPSPDDGDASEGGSGACGWGAFFIVPPGLACGMVKYVGTDCCTGEVVEFCDVLGPCPVEDYCASGCDGVSVISPPPARLDVSNRTQDRIHPAFETIKLSTGRCLNMWMPGSKGYGAFGYTYGVHTLSDEECASYPSVDVSWVGHSCDDLKDEECHCGGPPPTHDPRGEGCADLDIYANVDGGAACYWQNSPVDGLTLSADAHVDCAAEPANPENIIGSFDGGHDFKVWWNQHSNCSGQVNPAMVDRTATFTNTGEVCIKVNGQEIDPGAGVSFFFAAFAGYNTGDQSGFGGGDLFSVTCCEGDPPPPQTTTTAVPPEGDCCLRCDHVDAGVNYTWYVSVSSADAGIDAGENCDNDAHHPCACCDAAAYGEWDAAVDEESANTVCYQDKLYVCVCGGPFVDCPEGATCPEGGSTAGLMLDCSHTDPLPCFGACGPPGNPGAEWEYDACGWELQAGPCLDEADDFGYGCCGEQPCSFNWTEPIETYVAMCVAGTDENVGGGDITATLVGPEECEGGGGGDPPVCDCMCVWVAEWACDGSVMEGDPNSPDCETGYWLIAGDGHSALGCACQGGNADVDVSSVVGASDPTGGLFDQWVVVDCACGTDDGEIECPPGEDCDGWCMAEGRTTTCILMWVGSPGCEDCNDPDAPVYCGEPFGEAGPDGSCGADGNLQWGQAGLWFPPYPWAPTAFGYGAGGSPVVFGSAPADSGCMPCDCGGPGCDQCDNYPECVAGVEGSLVPYASLGAATKEDECNPGGTTTTAAPGGATTTTTAACPCTPPTCCYECHIESTTCCGAAHVIGYVWATIHSDAYTLCSAMKQVDCMAPNEHGGTWCSPTELSDIETNGLLTANLQAPDTPGCGASPCAATTTTTAAPGGGGGDVCCRTECGDGCGQDCYFTCPANECDSEWSNDGLTRTIVDSALCETLGCPCDCNATTTTTAAPGGGAPCGPAEYIGTVCAECGGGTVRFLDTYGPCPGGECGNGCSGVSYLEPNTGPGGGGETENRETISLSSGECLESWVVANWTGAAGLPVVQGESNDDCTGAANSICCTDGQGGCAPC